MKFNYQARTKEGEVQVGVVEAASKEAAISLLQKYGLYVTILEEVLKPAFYARELRIFRRVSKRDIIIFSRQLSIMFKSGVPLTEALRTFGRQTSNTDFKEKILKIAEEVEGGASLSKALLFYPKEFPSFYVNMIKSGEVGGKLSETLNYLTDHLEREYNINARIQGAMIYPAFVIVLFLIMGVLMSVLVLPQMINVMKETGQELPWLTRAIVFLTDILREKWWLIAIVLLGLIIFISRYLRTPEGKKSFDKYSLKIPAIGELLKKIYLSRFAENLSTLIVGGLPIAKALEVTSDVVGNDVYRGIILSTRDGVRRGEPMSSVLERYPEVISPFFIQMTLVGERTGRIEGTLLNIVNFYQEEVERTIESFLRLLEPILIIFLGLAVGGLAVSVLMPLYQMIGTY